MIPDELIRCYQPEGFTCKYKHRWEEGGAVLTECVAPEGDKCLHKGPATLGEIISYQGGRLCELEKEVQRLKKQSHSYRCIIAAITAMFSGYLGEELKAAGYRIAEFADKEEQP